jgi:hypothetical protein
LTVFSCLPSLLSYVHLEVYGLLKRFSYRFKGVALLRGGVDFAAQQDNAYSVIEVKTAKLMSRTSLTYESFAQLEPTRKAGLVARARYSDREPLPIPVVSLTKGHVKSFFQNYSLLAASKGFGDELTDLDLLFPHRDAIEVECIAGEDIILLFQALKAKTIPVQVPAHQVEIATSLMGTGSKPLLTQASANEGPKVLSIN